MCCDRHRPYATALRWETSDGTTGVVTFGELKELSSRFANLLFRLGVRPGDVVAAMLPSGLELAITLIGCLRVGAVYQPLSTSLGPKAIEQKVRASCAKVIITDDVNRAKLFLVSRIPVVRASDKLAHSDIDFKRGLENQSDVFESTAREPTDTMLLISISDANGKPCEMDVPMRALSSFETYIKYGVGLRSDDVYWNFADPSTPYGLYYAVLGPLLLGQAITFYGGAFTAEDIFRVIRKFGVTNLAGSTADYQLLLMQDEFETKVKPITGQLRVVSSGGEPLNAEVSRWLSDNLSCPVLHHFGLAECGMMIASHHELRREAFPDAAGIVLPGLRVVVLDGVGSELSFNEVGELTIDRLKSPQFWFSGYRSGIEETLVGPDRYYRTGNFATIGSNGAITFVAPSRLLKYLDPESAHRQVETLI